MRTRSRFGVFVGVAAVVALVAGGGPARAAEKVVKVDCARGQSINKALELKDEPLVVEIDGTCVEDVVVRRRGVTLRGSDPLTDGIRAADGANPIGATVLLDDAAEVVIENLTISGGGRDGLSFQESGPTIVVRNCRVEGNARFGVTSFTSVVELHDVVVTGNGQPCAGGRGTGILSFGNSSLICDGCTIVGNDGGQPGCDTGVSVGTGASAGVLGGSVSGNPAVLATRNGRLFTTDSQLTGVPVAAVSFRHGQATVSGGTIAGSLRADTQSLLNLRPTAAGGATQTANPAGNQVTRDALFETGPATVLTGHTAVDLFSQAIFRGSALGTLSCATGSDAVCLPGTTHTGSTCGGCP